MTETTMRGVYPILVMPFDEQSRIDEESLRSLVEFNIEQGAHGVGIALGSEVMKLSEAERVLATRTVVDQAGGRVPVVINTGSTCTDLAVFYSRMAEENGANALMVMPPSGAPATGPETREYYKAISDAVQIPIFIQDTNNPHVSAGLAVQIAEESEHVRYIKVESSPTTVMVAETVKQAGDKLTVFGGAGGNYYIEELRRGSQGTMPSCSQTAEFRQVWDHFFAGDEQGALDIFYRRILPINRLAAEGWGAFFHVNKEILRRRGVIRTAVVRGPIAPLDEEARGELDRTIEELYGC